MNINSLLSGNMVNLFGSSTSSAAGDASGTNGTNSANAASAVVSAALAKATQRLKGDQDTATAQLSSFGLLKSALASGQGAAQSMVKLSSSATASDSTKAMADFFNQFNTTMAAANRTAALPGQETAASSAKRVSRDLQWALKSQSAVADAMKTVGLTVQSDGSLKQDASKFANSLSNHPTAVHQAMVTLGKAIDGAAAAELGSTGTVTATLAQLNRYNSALTAQQQALAKLVPNTSSSAATTSKLAAYQAP